MKVEERIHENDTRLYLEHLIFIFFFLLVFLALGLKIKFRAFFPFISLVKVYFVTMKRVDNVL